MTEGFKTKFTPSGGSAGTLLTRPVFVPEGSAVVFEVGGRYFAHQAVLDDNGNAKLVLQEIQLT